MHSTITLVFLSVVAVARAAQPSPRWTTTTASQCDTGALQCCNSVEPASSANASSLLSGLGLLGSLTSNVPIGITCNPITALGLGSSGNCEQQPVCCENNSYNGLVNIGCSPVNLQG